jgi:hypothetical protein
MARLGKRGFAVVAAGLAATMAVSACSGQKLDGTDSGAKGGNVTLKVAFWGDMGLDKLKTQYETAHPNVKIVLGRVQRPARGPAEEAGRRHRRPRRRRDRRGLHRAVP